MLIRREWATEDRLKRYGGLHHLTIIFVSHERWQHPFQAEPLKKAAARIAPGPQLQFERLCCTVV